jgi:WD40 repeat protein
VVKREPLRLTKHLKEMRQFAPAYTGGAILVMKDEIHALAMRD